MQGREALGGSETTLTYLGVSELERSLFLEPAEPAVLLVDRVSPLLGRGTSVVE